MIQENLPEHIAGSLRLAAEAEKEAVKAFYEELDSMRETFQLPPLVISIRKERASSTMRIIPPVQSSSGLWEIRVNERIFKLNGEEKIRGVFRHMLIHLLQAVDGRRQTHTQNFLKNVELVKAVDPSSLKRPRPTVRLLTYICPTGCQQFRTEDSIVVTCYHCGRKMRALTPPAYQRFRETKREERQRVLEMIKKGDEDGSLTD